MKLQGVRSSATSASIPEALASAARTYGHAPALTVLLPHARFEQSFASLAQWTAKGAHLLGGDIGLQPGNTVGIDAPMSWPTATVALSAWWLGLTVILDGEGDLTIRHQRRAAAHPSADFWIGDEFDGGVHPSSESWPLAVQHFPDQPPPSVSAAGGLLRIDASTDTFSATQLLEMAHAQGSRRAALDAASTTISPAEALVAITLRPLVTGWTTVVLDGVSRAVATPERITTWLTHET